MVIISPIDKVIPFYSLDSDQKLRMIREIETLIKLEQ